MSPVKIIVEVRGGCVVGVYASNAEWLVLDHDNLASGAAPPDPDRQHGWEQAQPSTEGWAACRAAAWGP